MKIISFWKKKKDFLQLFHILKEPLLVQKQVIPQQRGLIQSFLEVKSLRVRQYQEDSTPAYRKRTLKKRLDLMELSQDAKNIVLIAQILFLYHEQSVCPLLLNYNKACFGSSLIARSTVQLEKLLVSPGFKFLTKVLGPCSAWAAMLVPCTASSIFHVLFFQAISSIEYGYCWWLSERLKLIRIVFYDFSISNM